MTGAPAHGRTWFLGSEIYRRPAFARDHPLAIERVGVVTDLCRILGWLGGGRYVESVPASVAELGRFHDRAYIDAVRRVSASGRAEPADRERYGLGSLENPVFARLFERASTACGASLQAVHLLLAEGGVAFNPAGGTHHGWPARARGFCYFNDPVLAVLALLDGGLRRVFYLDLDAHHGDGVELAFAGDARVFTLSIHERGRWPRSGALEDRSATVRNLPVPPGFNDSELAFLMREVVEPLARRFVPEAVVVTVGADALAGDPLSRLALGNQGLWAAVRAARGFSDRMLVLGGGGYNPWTLARCWSGLWGVLCGEAIPARLPEAAAERLCALRCDLIDEEDIRPEWFTTLADPPARGAIRAAVRALADAAGDPHA